MYTQKCIHEDCTSQGFSDSWRICIKLPGLWSSAKIVTCLTIYSIANNTLLAMEYIINLKDALETA